MYLINGEKATIPVTPGKQNTLVNEIARCRDYLKNKVGYPIIFKIPDRLVKVNSDGQKELPGVKKLVSVTTVQTEQGVEELRYCKSYKFDNDKNIVPFPMKIEFSKILIISEADWEKAVFLYKYSDTQSIEFCNPKKENKDRKNIRRIEANVRGTIFSPSKYGLTEEKLTQIALSYGIVSANNDIDEIQNGLFDKVQALQSKTKKGFNAFLEIAKMGKRVTILANIRIAEKEGKIKDFAENASTWGYQQGDGKMGFSIMSYISVDNKHEELADYFINNEKDYDEFVNVLGKLSCEYKQGEVDKAKELADKANTEK